MTDLNNTPPEAPATPEASAESISPEAARIAELETQLKEEKNKYLYLYAEFDNAKKRAVKERSELIKFGWEGVARELLGVLDNLDLALAHVPAGTDANWLSGIRMVAQQYQATLERQGVTPIRSETFDPNLHEAVGQEASDKPAGAIVKEHSRGFLLHGRLLRPARVVVSSGHSA